jgi:uncharacterized membrane protein
MSENDNKIDLLFERLQSLQNKQNEFLKEINSVRTEIINLKNEVSGKETIPNVEKIIPLPFETITIETKKPETKSTYQEYLKLKASNQQPSFNQESIFKPKIKGGIEKFIGENLISKIGIAITIIGVAIGAKYSIENELISPLTRIILGYLIGLGLLIFGIKLKKSYENYSAVLVSGSIAILYFITYAAYGFYNLIPQLFAFSLMVIFTAFTIVAAINYNKQVIAHIGLVGAYAVPFLLSEGSGQVKILFTYMAIINIGILIIAFKKYWKLLYYSSFILTWIIFFLWFVQSYIATEHFYLSLVFLSIFFAIFYLIFLGYKLIKKEQFGKDNIVMLLSNSFIFYGLGYAILQTNSNGNQLLGVFTLLNAIIHFIVGAIIYNKKLADKNMFYLVAGLVLVFITITFPVQLDGNWVTLLWAGEAAILFWIGRTKNISIYEKLSYSLMLLAFFSLVQDWSSNYSIYFNNISGSKITPLLNANFLTSSLFIIAFVFIYYLNESKKLVSSIFSSKAFENVVKFLIPTILIIALYFSFYVEISYYWNQLFADSSLTIKKAGAEYADSFYNYDLLNFKSTWEINYSILFFSILSFVNLIKIKNKVLGILNFSINILLLLIFLTSTLYSLSELRDSFLNQTLSEYYKIGAFNIGIRYVSFAFVSLLLYSIYKYTRQDFMKINSSLIKTIFDFLLHISVIWIASSELITWLNIMKFQQSYKLGLSILWGVYALLLIILGIWKNKKHLRIGAIALFAITLVKLFIYDISELNTIAKTIVFVVLGLLLLVISFLYNKYKHLISAENGK